ncbi:MAG: FAD-binding oxidoreductase [Verrucomicrobiota bacterium]
MPTHHVPLIRVLKPDEYERIDRFCKEHAGIAALPAIADLLRADFTTELVLDPDIIKGFAADSSNLPGHADALGRPQSERECAVLFRACFAAGIPFTLSAGRSNLTGSATPLTGVVISMARMLQPATLVDIEKRTVCSSVGVILENMRRQVLEQSAGRLFFPVDPTSRSDAMVGGAIACNASGFTPGEAGAMRPWVEAVDCMLPHGLKAAARRGEYVSAAGRFELHDGARVITLPVPCYPRPAIKNAGGPFSSPAGTMDFVDLITGSEGLFGAVTACVMRLAPHPSACLDLFFSVPDESNAVDFLDVLRSTLPGGLGCLSALEYFGANCRRFMEHESRFFHGNYPAGIYVQAPLSGQTLEDAAGEWLERLMAAGCGIDENAILLLDNERDRALFMEARHSMPAKAVELVQQRGAFTIMTDTVIPSNRFREFLRFTHGVIRSAGLDYLVFGHLGDCHLHFTILPEKDQVTRGAEIYDRIIAESARLGGVYSGEHGTGKRKRLDFIHCYGPAAVAQVRQCKAAVDPLFLMNRGNVLEVAIGSGR